jgi:flagellar basal-body rod protein FlgB
MMESEVEIKTTGSSQKRLPADGAFQKADLEMVETGQGVDLDTEMAKLAENNLMYNLAVELLARKFKGLDTVLKEAK